MFAQRLHVGQRLAGMVKIAQGVDDGHAGPLRQAFHRRVQKDAGDDGVDPAIQVSGDIFERLATPMGPSTATVSPPNYLMASSKVRRVRREGFSKSRAMDLPSSTWA